MDVRIICIGKLKESYWRDACAEYAKRLAAYCRFEIVELAECRCGKMPSTAELDAVIEDEGGRIIKQIGKNDHVIAMCIEGDLISSEQLAKDISLAALSGHSTIDLIIGGSYGLSSAVKSRANLRASIGRMTFPHQLARVMMCEQLYRAFSINEGGKYHK